MKKLLFLTVTLTILSCNSDKKEPSGEATREMVSSLELAKSTLDQIFENADHYEKNGDTTTITTIMAPYGSNLNRQLDSLKSTLTEKELKEFNAYATQKFDETYPQS